MSGRIAARRRFTRATAWPSPLPLVHSASIGLRIASMSLAIRSAIVPSCVWPRYCSSFSASRPAPTFRNRSCSGRPRLGRQVRRVSISSSIRAAADFDVERKGVARRDRMDDDLLVFLRAFLGGLAGDQGRALEHRREPVVGAGDVALGENHQRAFGRLEDLDRRLHRLLVHPFAIDRKRAGPPQQERLELAAHEQVGAGDDEERPAEPRGPACSG